MTHSAANNLPSDNSPRIAVVGGGISGLAAAHRIHELLPHADLAVLEAADRLGGLLHTVHRDGFLVEQSADSFLTKLPWAADLCRRIGIADQLIPTAESRRRAMVVRGDELLPVPEGFVLIQPRKVWPLLTTRLLSWPGKLRLLAEPFVRRRNASGGDAVDESVASFATRRLGREAFERLVQPLLAGIYTADAEQLSMAATLPEFLLRERQFGSLFRGVDKLASDPGHVAARIASRIPESGARYALFVAPRDGIGTLVETLAACLPSHGIRANTQVKHIRRNGNRSWQLTTDQETQPFDAVVVALPAHAAAHVLAEVDSELSAELAKIEYASCAVVSLGYRRTQIGRPLDGFGFVVPKIENRPIIAASFASEKFAGRAPEGRVLVRVFVGGALRPELAELPADELAQIAHGELARLMRITGSPEWTDVARWPRSMPQYHVGHLERVAAIESRALQLPGLALAGNAYHGVGIPQCIHSGEHAAEQIAAWLRRTRQ